MAKNSQNIRSGPGTLFYAPNGTAPPNLEDVPNGIMTPTMWTTATYVELPFTTEGISIVYSEDVFDHEVNEALAPVGGTVQKVAGEVTFTIAESNADAFALAMNAMTKTTVSAGASQAGLTKVVYDGSNELTFLTLAHLSTLNGKSMLHACWKCAANGGFTAAYKKGEMTVVDVKFRLYEDPEVTPAEERMYSQRQYTAPPSS